ncbi:Uma2 family endonuclease [Streptomyces sp. NBC_00249]|uniref:Uma2 family endonuclease n=1 Tax=Streptomyces sp. NBC_00249 TaxID=2975690 RepID=UPI00224FB352|nr:Uma2 family endonuclease [Streptomyces sp. NBC_00249]MCX5199115.1 Uma2 family endonuclease [Streptomyces sp. NBC_00249]
MAVIQHETTIAEAADRLSRELPGHRVEILQGRLTVTPPADGSHALSLSWLIEKFYDAGARKAGLRYVQGIGLWLPTGSDDYAIPDFALVEADFRDHKVQKNCYPPDVFRLVVEVTSSNWSDDIGVKVDSYAKADIPVYVIADRHHDEAVLCCDPRDGTYRLRTTYKRGTSIPLPQSIGVSVELPVDLLLDGDEG